ncbi:type II secretion system F family protein [Agromyces endophyticus]|uniref:type II secretion system F family protein n=1 Tax=Agromyces sp. H17E-10 TaxID=2932244 RepID=UPI001FD01E5E|nr:type II secretion system F family protein [Agromyces sp. H17E-10]UOQ90590.1 type II secretion system F family protein [Agromyces sp. H17E-10]
MNLVMILSIAAVAVGIGLFVFLLVSAIPSNADVRAVVSPASEQERLRVERRTFAQTLVAVMPTGYTGWIQRKIIYAGRTNQWTVGGFLTLRIVVGAIGLLIVVLTLILAKGVLPIVAGLLFGLLIIIAPDVMLSSRADDRQKAILLALPDTLDQMTIAVEAGLGFEAAMAKAARGGSGPLSEELIRTLQDMSIGRSRYDSYDALLARTDCADLKRFVRAIQQADRYGIAIADVLRVQSGEMRVKRRQRAEESAMKVPIKVVFPLVFTILPVLFIVLLFPAVVGMVKTFGGY